MLATAYPFLTNARTGPGLSLLPPDQAPPWIHTITGNGPSAFSGRYRSSLLRSWPSLTYARLRWTLVPSGRLDFPRWAAAAPAAASNTVSTSTGRPRHLTLRSLSQLIEKLLWENETPKHSGEIQQHLTVVL